MFRVAAVPLLALALAAAPCLGADSADTAPITIQVSSPMASERGLSRIVSGAASGDTEASARAVERELQQFRWLRIVDRDPEVRVTIDRRERTETGRSTDKNGGVTINHRYTTSASLLIGRDRDRVDAEKSYSQGPTMTRDDALQFGEVAREVTGKVAGRIALSLDALRPNRPQAGFDHKAKYKMLFRGDGLEVTAVAPGGPADAAGLQVADRIRSIDGEKNTDKMNARIFGWWTDPPGARYAVEFERNKQKRTVQLSLLPARQWGGGGRPAAQPAAVQAVSPRSAPARETAPAGPAARSAAAPASAPGGSGGSGVEIKPGMTPAQVTRSLGEPQKRVTFGSKTIWTYDGFTVTFVDGKVSDVK
jgi:hypothetical protein